MALTKQTILGLSWSGLSSVITAAVQGMQLVIFARLLQPADFGLIGITMVALGFVLAYSDAGISGAIIHHQESSNSRLSTLLYYNLFVGALLFVVLQLCVPLIVSFFGKPGVSLVLRAASISVLGFSAGKVFETLLQKELKFKEMAIIEMLSTILSFAATLPVLFIRRDVWAMVFSFVAFSIVRAIAYVIVGYRYFKPSFHFDVNDLKDGYIGFGLFQIGERTINYFAQRLDQLVIGRQGSASLLGSYTIAFNAVVQPLASNQPGDRKSDVSGICKSAA